MDGGSHTGALLPATAELMERIGWFIRLRWVAVAGVALFVVVGRRLLPVSIHMGPVLATLALLAVYNGLATLYFRKLSTPSHPSRGGRVEGRFRPRLPETDFGGGFRPPFLARWLLPRTLRGLEFGPGLIRTVYFVNVQMILDLIFLAILLHFTGGIENPLRMFFLFHVIIAAILLSKRATYFYATAALLLMGFVALGELTGWLPHYTLSAHWRPGAYADPRLAGTQLFLLGTTLYITAYMAGSIGAQLRQRELDVFLLSRELEDKAARLESAYHQVSAAERAKSQYMRKVAHELRGPLGTLQTALGVVLEKVPETVPEALVDLVQRAWTRSGELAQMTRELLSLSRAREVRLAAEAVLLDPREVSERVLEEMRLRASQAGVSLNLEIAPELPALEADPEGITDLLTNLLGNAIRYTPSGGSVTFTLGEEHEHLVVEVRDTGIGISEVARDRIFEEFYRSEEARAHAPEGSGLGMAIVKAVVDQHGGTITVDSEVGRGTGIRVELPYAWGEKAAPDRAPTLQASAEPGGRVRTTPGRRAP